MHASPNMDLPDITRVDQYLISDSTSWKHIVRPRSRAKSVLWPTEKSLKFAGKGGQTWVYYLLYYFSITIDCVGPKNVANLNGDIVEEGCKVWVVMSERGDVYISVGLHGWPIRRLVCSWGLGTNHSLVLLWRQATAKIKLSKLCWLSNRADRSWQLTLLVSWCWKAINAQKWREVLCLSESSDGNHGILS